MAKMHQLLAVKKDLAQRANEIYGETVKVLKKAHLFHGSVKSYEHFDEAEATLAAIPDEIEVMGYTVEEKLQWFDEQFSRLIDADYQIDTTNGEAFGDLKIGEKVISAVPAAFLLDLVGHFTKVRALYANIPVLDPKHAWTLTPDQGKNVYGTAQNEITYRTKKTLGHKVLVEATPEHPAQVEKWNEDVRIGKFTKKIWSGATTAHDKALLLARIDQVIEAAKIALSQANEKEHSKEKIAKQLFDWIHDETNR